MNRKIIIRILIFLLVGMILFSSIYYVFAEGIDDSSFTAASIILVEAESGDILYEKDPDVRRAPASTTKLITALLAVEHLPLEKVVTVPAEAQTGGSVMGLKPGQTVTVETLLYGLLLSSGNDAAVTIAIEISGNVEDFAVLMNEKAKALGMLNSHFVTASGLDDQDHYVTARDMSYVAREVYKDPLLRRIISTTTVTRYTEDKTVSFVMENTNMLIHTPEKMADGSPYSGPEFLYTYANGMKTGSTAKAKGCLIASAEKEDLSLIAVILGDKSSGELERWTDAAMLFDFGFSQYQKVLLTDLIGEDILLDVEGAPVVDGVQQKLKCLPVTMDGSYYLMIKGELDRSLLTHEINRNESVLTAPLNDGTEVGTIIIKNDGHVMMYGKLLAAESMITDEEYRQKQEQSVIITDDTNGVIKEDVFKRMFWPVLVVILIVLTILLIYFILLRKNRYAKVHGKDDYSKDLRRNVKRERERYVPRTAREDDPSYESTANRGSIGRRVRRK